MKGKLTIRRYLQVTDNLAETTTLKKATAPKSDGFICSPIVLHIGVQFVVILNTDWKLSLENNT